MMKCAQVSLPEIGSQRSVSPKNRISSSANQNGGIAWPITATVRVRRSIQLLGRIAAATPSGIDSASAKLSAMAPSDRVVPIRSHTMAATGVRK